MDESFIEIALPNSSLTLLISYIFNISSCQRSPPVNKISVFESITSFSVVRLC